jgi:manganese/zinc/iron transport system permease protein
MSADLVIVLTAVLVAIPCALLGTLLVLRQMSMMGDAISHAVLPGHCHSLLYLGEPGCAHLANRSRIFGLLQRCSSRLSETREGSRRTPL